MTYEIIRSREILHTRKRRPENMSYRLAVKKTYNSLKPLAVDIRVWLTDTFGPSGERWVYQSMAHPAYLVYWFRDEKDLAWAMLRWS